MRSWILVATVMLVLLYWAFAGDLSLTEAVAMLIPLASAVALMLCLDRVAQRRISVHAPWPKLLLRTFASIGKDSFKVGVFLAKALLRRPPRYAGGARRQPFRFGSDSPAEATRRALVVLSISASPDRYVIDVHHDDSLVAHSLVGGPTTPDPEWPV